MTSNHCGGCTMCCKLLDIAELDKPKDKWCPDCAIGLGCTIYDARPAPCRDFACLWLESQSTANPLPGSLRPDRSRMMLYFSEDRKSILGRCDPARPNAWQEVAVSNLLRLLSAKGTKIMFDNGRDYFAMDGPRARRAALSPPDSQGIRYFLKFLD